jgi:hypothetical protein
LLSLFHISSSQGTAITLDANTGAMGGVPNRVDVLASPLKLTVRCELKLLTLLILLTLLLTLLTFLTLS